METQEKKQPVKTDYANYAKRMAELGKRSANQKNEVEQATVREEFPELITLEKLMSMEFPKGKWVIEKLIPDQGITIIAGPAGNFKTWILLLMSICIAKGEKFLDTFPCSRAGVLIVDEENHLRELKERLGLLGTTNDLPIYFLSQKGFLVEKEHWIKKVLDICEAKKIDVIFFDSLIRIHESDENAASTMSKVFRQIKKFCQAKKTVIITHHERKEGVVKSSGQNRMRGSSDIAAAVDSHLTIRRAKEDRDTLIIEQPKLRSDREIDPFEISVICADEKISLAYKGAHSEETSKKELAKEAVASILEEEPSGLTRGEITERVRDAEGIGGKSTKKAIDELIKDGNLLERQGDKNTKICYLPKFDQEETITQEDLI